MGAPQVYRPAGSVLSTRIRDEARAALERIAQLQGRSLSRVVADAVELYAAAIDDEYEPLVTGPADPPPALFEHAQAS